MFKTGLYLVVIILAITFFEEYIAKGGVTKSAVDREGKKFCKKSKFHRQNRDLDVIKSVHHASNSIERRHTRTTDCKLLNFCI